MYRTVETVATRQTPPPMPGGTGQEVEPSQVWGALYAVAVQYLIRGVSIVVDATWTPGRAEPEIVEHLGPHAQLVQVFCTSVDATSRSIQRARHSPRWGVPPKGKWLEEYARYVRARYRETSSPLKLDALTIEVDTTDGYSPELPVIVNAILNLDRDKPFSAHLTLAGPVP